VSARRIRQEIRREDDIFNAFDAITYDKGAGVIAMIERWLGPEVSRDGVRLYLQRHRASGSASEADLLAALSETAKKDVAAPFRSFLEQPGVPIVEASLACEKNQGPSLKLRQSRYLPTGSSGDPGQTWQIPICARYAVGNDVKQSCTLLTEREGALPLEAKTCPAWVLPNADAAGYYYWSLPPDQLKKLASAGYPKLREAERMGFAQSLRASYARATTPAAEVLGALAPLAAERSPLLVQSLTALLREAADWLGSEKLRASAEAYGRKLFAPAFKDLAWAPKKEAKETEDRRKLRRLVIDFLLHTARDPQVIKEAATRGRAFVGLARDRDRPAEPVDPALLGIALAAAIQEGGGPVFDAVLAKLAETRDEAQRRSMIEALGTPRGALGVRARALALDPRLSPEEVMIPIFTQLALRDAREATFRWLEANLDAILARLATRKPFALRIGAFLCDEARADAVEKLFASRIDKIEGGPHLLAGALERIRLCAARRKAQEPSLRAFFAKAR
jgi:alanyl aminopeptidase